MIFASPHFLYFLLAAPALAGLKAWADWRGSQAVNEFSAPRLRQMLVGGISQGRSWLIFALQLLALSCFILALAGPRWGEEKAPLMESGRNVLIAIDTSRSMLANDVTPDRLTRAKLAAQDLLTVLKADRVGLIAFAGNAYLQAPMTTDHEAVIESIQSLDQTSVPRGGSEIGRALKLAMETFEKSPARNHGLVLFSDGGEPNSQITALSKEAAKKNVLIITVGVGTEAGALIPDPDPERAGDYVRDRNGNIVKTKLESSVLQEIAATTHGRYLKLGSQPLAASVVKEMLAALQAQTNAARETVKPIERFYWPLSIGILFLMIAWFIRPSFRFRPAPVIVLAVLTGGLMPPPASAGVLSSLFFGADKNVASPKEAQESFEKGDFEKARDLYGKLVEAAPKQVQYAYGLGASALQMKDYDRAVGAFSEALESPDQAVQNKAHRGVAHSLYDQGDYALAKQPKFTLKAWRDSVRHFDAALKLDPNNKEVRENREFVKKRLDELQKQIDQQEQKGNKGKKGDKKKGQKGQKGEKGEGEEGDEGDEPGDQAKDEDAKPKDSLAKDKGDKEGKEEALPEGKIRADNEGEEQGKEGKESEKEQADQGDNERHEATGFSRNEARSFLRTYADDQKKAQLLRPRDEPVNGKDW